MEGPRAAACYQWKEAGHGKRNRLRILTFSNAGYAARYAGRKAGAAGPSQSCGQPWGGTAPPAHRKWQPSRPAERLQRRQKVRAAPTAVGTPGR